MSDPIPMVLHCPRCGFQHIDAPEPEKGWENPPHRSHLCSRCRYVWRPCDLPTVGVDEIDTRGSRDDDPVPPFEDRVCDAVDLRDGNTEINECYFEVTFLDRVVWSRGGRSATVPVEAQLEVTLLCSKIRNLIRGKQ